jgi:hypothetical protein
MAIIPSNLFNTATLAVKVSFNRGPWVSISAISAPSYKAQMGFPAPQWDNGGPSAGNLGPGPGNTVSLQTGGMVLPLLTFSLPNMPITALQTYVLWSMDPSTFASVLVLGVLSSGQIIAVNSTSGTAQPIS